MSDDIKHKAVSGIIWSFIERLAQQLITFSIGILLARILSPSDYGLMAMLMVFSTIANTLIDGGFQQALIRKLHTDQYDYSTVFITNIVLSVFLYIIFYLIAPFIASFYEQPELLPLSRFVFLTLIFNSLGIIQNAIVNRELRFKVLAKTNILSGIISGTIALIMALKGYGAWALAIQMVVASFLSSAFLWTFNSWRPTRAFSISHLKNLFSFGSNLMVSALLDTIFNNIYFLVIGKYYNAFILGFYSRAKTIQELPVSTISTVFQRVSYPILSSFQDENSRLKMHYKKVIKSVIFINFPIMIGMIIIAKPLILLLLTEKWIDSVPYLQLFCIIGYTYPLSSINLNILKVKGKSDLFLRLEIIKKILIVISVLITLHMGIMIILLGQVILSVIFYFINAYYSGKLINYSIREQLKDIAPYCATSLLMGILISLLLLLHIKNDIILLLLQSSVGFVSYILFSIWLKLDMIGEFRDNIKIKLKRLNIIK